jgi:uncharacterized membrane protein
MNFIRWIGKHGELLMTLVWIFISALEFAAPIIYKANNSSLFYLFLKPLCHQNYDRSFFIGGCKLGLCARCTGIFTGLAVFGIAALILRLRKGLSSKQFLFFLAPLVLDGTAQTIGLWNTGNFPRLLTGIIASFGIVFFIYPIIFDANRSAECEPREKVFNSELN